MLRMINNLPRSSPEEQGVSSLAIADFIAYAELHLRSLHSFMLLRHGNVVAEGWWYPWKSGIPQSMYSLSKSFTSSAVGLAVAEGLLSVEDPVLSFFPTDAPRKASPNLQAMKVHHLLSMSTGHDQDTSGRVFPHRNPFKEFLSLPVEHVPGTHFVYNTAASFILAAILQKLTHQTLIEYLTPRLFDPLGIAGATWESHPNGINFGGWGLNIKTEDIARFGQLYLQNGIWQGKRILPEWWLRIATAKQVSNGDDPNSDWAQGYGYQFWRCRHNIYRADGAFGQFCIIMPDQDAVLAITAGIADMQSVLNVVWDKLLPAMDKDPLPGNEPVYASLRRIETGLSIPPPAGDITSPTERRISGKTYTFMPNHVKLHSLRIDFHADFCNLTYRLLGGGKRRGNHQLKIGYANWQVGFSDWIGPTTLQVAASGVWSDVDTFILTICQVETPIILTLTFKFTQDQVLCDSHENVGFGPLDYPQLVGTAE